MFYLKSKRLYGLAVLVVTAAFMFILFAVLGLNGISITAPASGVLVIAAGPSPARRPRAGYCHWAHA